jgi:hypothetical protein
MTITQQIRISLNDDDVPNEEKKEIAEKISNILNTDENNYLFDSKIGVKFDATRSLTMFDHGNWYPAACIQNAIRQISLITTRTLIFWWFEYDEYKLSRVFVRNGIVYKLDYYRVPFDDCSISIKNDISKLIL